MKTLGAPHMFEGMSVSPDTDRSAMMPRRKQTREQAHRDRINAERRERTELIGGGNDNANLARRQLRTTTLPGPVVS
ncbi:MAG TPA: hypothetical protein VN856_18970, partial [Mycobacterium sp.]|nr:hypothetical protein [Mycobacterium sp.]